MRRLSLTLLLIPSALYLSAEEPTHPFTINASGAQVLLEPGSTLYSWNNVSNTQFFLSKEEWEYLLANNQWRFIQRESATLLSSFGMVIYPIDFPEGSIIGDPFDFPGEIITEAKWEELENAGARFIYYYKISETPIGYWTTTESNASNGYYVMFRPSKTPRVTCTATDAKTTTKLFVRVTRLPAPSCDCFTVHF